METTELLDAVERYLNGEMNEQEKLQFEQLRASMPEVDQMAVEHQLFLKELSHYGSRKQINMQLQEVHNRLFENGEIKTIPQISTGAKVVQLWNKHKRTVAVAASIAGITALTISGMVGYFAPKGNADIDKLKRDVSKIAQNQLAQNKAINDINSIIPKAPKDQQQRSAGTSFLLDTKGLLVTNSHVVDGATTLVVVNNNNEYYAKIVYNDVANDIAILKIEDKDFTNLKALPYSIRKSGADLGEEIFTLGYPRNQIVYGKGYLSAQSGFNDDTLSVQISVDANPGNSGGPVLDKNGDVIGILNSRETNANGVVFANKAINIAKALGKLKESDSTFKTSKLPIANSLRGKERTQQVKQIEDCVFMVKGYRK
jgi:serine protease Do